MMDSTDVSPLMDASDSTPEEAGKNIMLASNLDMQPDDVKSLGPAIHQSVQAATPQPATPQVAKTIADGGAEVAAVMKPNLPQHNASEGVWNYYQSLREGNDVNRQIADLSRKQLEGQTLSLDEKIELENLNYDRDNMTKSQDAAGYPWFERWPVKGAAGLEDFAKGLWNQKPIISTATGLGAATGLPAFAAGPVAGAIATLSGAVTGATVGTLAAGAVDQFDQTSALLYNDFNRATDDKGKPLAMPQDTKVALANGTAGLATIAGFATHVGLANLIPGLGSAFSTTGLSKLLLSPENSAMMGLASALGRSSLIGAIGTGSQAAISIVGEEIAKSWDGTQASFVSGVNNAIKHWDVNGPAILEAAGTGGAMGATTVLAGRVLSHGLPDGMTGRVSGEERDVTPPSRPQLPGVVENDGVTSGDVSPTNPSDGSPTVRSRSDLVGEIPSIQQKGMVGLQLQTALLHDSNLNKDTAAKINAPGTIDDLRQNLAEQAGVPHVYGDIEDLRKFADNPEKGSFARKLLTGDQVATGQLNAPFKILTHDFLNAVDENPEIAGIAKETPDGMSGNQYVEFLKAQEEQRQEMLKSLPEAQRPLSPSEEEELSPDAKKIQDIAKMDVDPIQKEIELQKAGIEASQNKVAEINANPEKFENPDLENQLAGRIKTQQAALVWEKTQFEDATKKLLEYENGNVKGLARTPKGDDKTLRDLKAEVELRKGRIELHQNQIDLAQRRAPEILNVLNSIARINEIGNQKDKIEGHYKEIDELTPYLAKAKIKDATTPERMEDSDIWNEKDYLDQPTFTEAIKDVLPQKQVDKFNQAQLKARQAVVDSINEGARLEMNKVIDTVQAIAMTELAEETKAHVANDPNMKVVEDFLGNKIVGELRPDEQDRIKRGVPAMSIDPRTLTEEVRRKYQNDPVLKLRKVFSKGGADVNDVLTQLGVRDADTLLDILGKTPTREQAVKNAQAENKEAIRSESEKAVDLNHTAIAKAYNDNTRNHLREMKFLLDQEWPSAKGGIKKIALPLPRMSELAIKANDMVNKTPIRDLNANQWKVGERKSQRNAVTAILKNQVEKAFTEKEKAAQNSELAKRTHIAIGEVNRLTKRIARIDMNEIRDAGPLYVNALEEIQKLWNFKPSPKDQARTDYYEKFAQKMIEQGQGDFTFEPEAQAWLTGKKSAKELSVEQFKYVAGKMLAIEKMAQLKNDLIRNSLDDKPQRIYEYRLARQGEKGYPSKTPKMFVKFTHYEPGLPEQSLNQIAEVYHAIALTHPDYNTKNWVNPQGYEKPLDWLARRVNGFTNQFDNIDSVLLHYDQGVVGGPYSQLLGDPIRGVGIFDKTGQGRAATAQLAITHQNHEEKLIKAFNKAMGSGSVSQKLGDDAWSRMAITRRHVPEFEPYPILKNGDITVQMLHEMLRHMGNAENIASLTNFGPSEDEMWRVLKRELPKPHFDMVQSIWDEYESYKNQLDTLEKNTTGNQLDFTIAQGFSAHGSDYRGGHYPLTYADSATAEKIKEQNEKAFANIADGKKATFLPDRTHDGIVASPFTKDRVGSKWYVNLSPLTHAIGIEKLIYDLTMRIPVADTMKLLLHPQISKDMIAMGGETKYKTLIGYVAEATNSNFANNMQLYSDQDRAVKNFFGTVANATIISALGAKLSVTFLQPVAFTNVVQRMGLISGPKYLGTASMRILSAAALGQWGEMTKFAAEIEPSIGTAREGMDLQAISNLGELQPKNRLFKNRPYNVIKNAQESTIDWTFHKFISTVDTATKVVTGFAALNQFMDGNAPGHPLSEISKLSPEVRFAQGKAYASMIIRTSLMSGSSLDKAVYQKNPNLKLFTMYSNILRNTLNTNAATVKKARYDLIDVGQAAKAGNRLAMQKSFRAASDGVHTMLILSMVNTMMQGYARGHDPMLKNGETEISLQKDLQRLPEFITHYYTGFGPGKTNFMKQAFYDNIPGLNDIEYAENFINKKGEADAKLPITQAMSDAATTSASLTSVIAHTHDWLSFSHAIKGLNEKQVKAMVATASIPVGGNFTAAEFALWDYIQKQAKAGKPISPLGDVAKATLGAALGQFVADHGEETKTMTAEEKAFDDLFKQRLAVSEGKTEVQQAVEQVEAMKVQVDGEGPIKIPDAYYSAVQEAESGGNKYAQNKHSSAHGPFQFLRGTAEEAASWPESKAAGLTFKNIMRNPEKQRQAMEFKTQREAVQLKAAGIPVEFWTLYGAHHFGVEGFKDIFEAKPKDKLSTVLTHAQINANPTFKSMKTVKDLTDWIKSYIEDAHESVQDDQKKASLTSNDSP